MMITNLDTLYANDEPGVNTDVTVCYISDSHPATIIQVKHNRQGKATHIQVQMDDWKVVSGSMQDGSAEFEYTENKNNPTMWFRLRKNGRWVRQDQPLNATPVLSIGHKRKYHDPHF